MNKISFLPFLLLVGCQNQAVFFPVEADLEVTNQQSVDLVEVVETDTSVETRPDLPDKYKTDLKFYPQAPYGDWGALYQEACEEASVLLAANELLDLDLSRKGFDQKILEMVEAEIKYLGFYESTTVAELADFSESYFQDLSFEIVDQPDLEDIKLAIYQGGLVILPLSGRTIGNPYYSGEGPVYHMLVVNGYDRDELITQDVGTKRGADYVYPAGVLINALHDYNQDDILEGERRMIVVKNKF